MRPAILCHLKKGTLIDANPGFVDTFNWLVDFCNNLQGDKDLNRDKHISVNKTKDDHPVIEFDGEAGSGAIAVADDQIVVISHEWTGAEGGDDGLHPYCWMIKRGRLAIGEAADENAGKLIIQPDDTLTTYIETTPLSYALNTSP